MSLEFKTTLEESLILTLFDLVNFMIKFGEVTLQDEDITAQQWLVLLQIAGDPNFPRPGGAQNAEINGGVLASDIAASRGVSRANISTLTSSLLKKQLIRRREDPADRRRKFLEITSRGKEILERVEPIRKQSNRELFEGLSNSKLQALQTVLHHCLEKFWQLNADRQPARN